VGFGRQGHYLYLACLRKQAGNTFLYFGQASFFAFEKQVLEKNKQQVLGRQGL